MSRNNNIGTLRFLGAFMVLFSHGYALSIPHGKDPISLAIVRYTPWHQPLSTLGVIMFFVLSGYLVTQSYINKNSPLYYMLARCLRIYPALIVAVLFCVLVVGASQTTLSLTDYFCHPGTLWYFINNATLRVIQVDLPGVFAAAPFPGSVNGVLWTLPIELGLYVVVGFAGMAGLIKRKVPGSWVILMLIGAIVVLPGYLPKIFLLKIAPYLAIAFLMGMFFYINREILKPNGRVALVLLAGCILLREVNVLGFYYRYVALVPFVYLVMYLAFMPLRLPALDKYGDFSYGLYLYAFPLQQMSVVYFGEGQPLLVNAVALAGSLLLAIFSWYCVERPALLLSPRSRLAQQESHA